MLNQISEILFAGLGVSGSLAAYQDFKHSAIRDVTWIPALLGVLGYLYAIGSLQFAVIEFVWMAIVLGIATWLHIKKIFAGGDVVALSLFSFAAIGFVISTFAALALSFKIKDAEGKVPFVGLLGAAFVTYAIVMVILPTPFL